MDTLLTKEEQKRILDQLADIGDELYKIKQRLAYCPSIRKRSHRLEVTIMLDEAIRDNNAVYAVLNSDEIMLALDIVDAD